MPGSNLKIAEILKEIGEYLAMKNVPFKPRAYEKAAETLASLEEDLEIIYKRGGVKELMKIPGIGASMASHIEEFLKTGKIKEYDALKRKTPVNLSALSKIEGLGPKSIEKLYKSLGITTIEELEKAAKAGKIAEIPGFQKKTEENILKGIEFYKTSSGRTILGFAMPRIKLLEERLSSQPGVEKVMFAGSSRRRKETIGDIDLLVIAKKSEEVMKAFAKMPEILKMHGMGETKASARFSWGMDVDVRVVPKESYGAALLYFTGSKDHNIALRQFAIRKGYKLNEYGLFKITRGKEIKVAGETEEEIYEKLGLEYIPPEMRENTGEIELAEKGELPKIVEEKDILGDLQVQTDWTDGSESIEAMAKVAMKKGLKYMAVTDHTKRLAMTNGLDEKRILKQMAEIDRLNLKFGKTFKILKGTECDILKDGSMDLSDDVLEKLDFVGGSLHSHFRLPREEQTERVMRAMENPNVDMIFHPTARIIGRREPCDLDMEKIIKKAKQTNTALEIDSYPDRTDLKDEYIRKCVETGVKMAIDSDAHNSSHFAFLEYGVSQARRGWAKKTDILNTKSAEELLKYLK